MMSEWKNWNLEKYMRDVYSKYWTRKKKIRRNSV